MAKKANLTNPVVEQDVPTTDQPIIETNDSDVDTIKCSIKNIQVYSNNDSIRYRVVFDTKFTGIVRDRDTGEYIEREIDYIDFVPRFLIAQCIANIEGLSLVYNSKKERGLRSNNGEGFGAAELQVILNNAKIVLKRNRFEEGDEYANADGEVFVHNNTGYNTEIVSIKVSERIQTKLDSMIDNMFLL